MPSGSSHLPFQTSFDPPCFRSLSPVNVLTFGPSRKKLPQANFPGKINVRQTFPHFFFFFFCSSMFTGVQVYVGAGHTHMEAKAQP